MPVSNKIYGPCRLLTNSKLTSKMNSLVVNYSRSRRCNSILSASLHVQKNTLILQVVPELNNFNWRKDVFPLFLHFFTSELLTQRHCTGIFKLRWYPTITLYGITTRKTSGWNITTVKAQNSLIWASSHFLPQDSFLWYFSSWTSGAPHNSGFKFESVALTCYVPSVVFFL